MEVFQIGDRVIAIEGISSNDRVINKVGTVIGFSSASRRTCVEFDEYIKGHTGNGKGKDGYCWFLHHENLVFANPQEIKKSKFKRALREAVFI